MAVVSVVVEAGVALVFEVLASGLRGTIFMPV
jgi:hypothetical protein